MSDAPEGIQVRFRLPMTGRDTTEERRGTTPLELLYDLSFVVAVSGAAAGLHGALAAHSEALAAHAAAATGAADAIQPPGIGSALAKYAMVFFAIWWAWMNFTWFASAFDTDDVLYRLMVLVQMSGALVLAAGVPAGFQRADFTVITIGYTIMRAGMIALWVRSAVEHPPLRRTGLLVAGGLAVVQALWLLRLLLPPVAGVVAFCALVLAEVAIPFVAENVAGRTPWHPGHIADRYGGFTVIVLGEVILASSASIQQASTEGLSADLIMIGIGGLIGVFSLWWLYFKRPAEISLRSRAVNPFAWGYGHYLVFAAVAAVGAGIGALAELHREPGTALRPIALVLTGACALYLAVLAAVRWAEARDGAAVARYATGVVALLVIGVGGLRSGPTVLGCGLVLAAVLAWHLWAASGERPGTPA
jgi:low temperature requirement protein LtrA